MKLPVMYGSLSNSIIENAEPEIAINLSRDILRLSVILR